MTTTERLRRSVAALSSGDLVRARHEAEAALRAQPNAPAVLQLLGVICCQGGDVRRGADQLRKAIRLGADTNDNRMNLARALVELGEFSEAESVCRPAAGQQAPPAMHRLRADILKAQNRHSEAVALYEEVLAGDPRDFETWNNLGNARLGLGDLGGGLAALEQARLLSPANATIHLNIGRALDGAGSHQEGLASLREAARLAPGDPAIQLEYGKALQRVGSGNEALAPLGAAARLDPSNPDALVTLGLTLAGLAQPDQAERAYRFALRADPRSPAAFLNLAILLEQANRLDELAALAGRATADGLPRDERDYVEALLLRRQGRLDEALRLAQSSFPESLDPAMKALFVGQVADRLGDADTAFAAFDDMNRMTAAKPEARRFDGSEHRLYVEGLAAATTAEWVASWRPAEPERAQPAPAFLLGFLRSGTTLLDTILMGHDSTHVLEEEPILAHLEDMVGDLARLGQLRKEDVDALRRRYFSQATAGNAHTPGALIVDKNPLASLRAPLIHRLFPDARFIFALRHPCDVVLSCFMQNFQVNQAMASFLDLRDAALLYDRVMAYWQHCRELLPLAVHTIRYEDLVEDVEAEIRPLLAFLGLGWDEKVLDHQRAAEERGFIRTPSYAQVTEGIYSRASGRWVRYRRHLEHVLPILAPWAERFGYAMD